jgi:DNA-binding CsgD family transcriptional regulator
MRTGESSHERRLQPTGRCTRSDLLIARENEVVTRAIDGQPLKVIAAELEISIQAVSTYLGRARHKLGRPAQAQEQGPQAPLKSSTLRHRRRA